YGSPPSSAPRKTNTAGPAGTAANSSESRSGMNSRRRDGTKKIVLQVHRGDGSKAAICVKVISCQQLRKWLASGAPIRPPVRPRRGSPVEPGGSDPLTPMFVGVRQQPQVDSSHGRLFTKKIQAPIQFVVACLCKGLRHCLQGSLQQADHCVLFAHTGGQFVVSADQALESCVTVSRNLSI